VPGHRDIIKEYPNSWRWIGRGVRLFTDYLEQKGERMPLEQALLIP
jgi:hypothetical protein